MLLNAEPEMIETYMAWHGYKIRIYGLSYNIKTYVSQNKVLFLDQQADIHYICIVHKVITLGRIGDGNWKHIFQPMTFLY